MGPQGAVLLDRVRSPTSGDGSPQGPSFGSRFSLNSNQLFSLQEPVSSPAFLALPKPNVFVPERLELVTNVAAPEVRLALPPLDYTDPYL